MRFFRRTEIGIDSKMQNDWTGRKPGAPALREFGWLRDFRKSEDSAIESSRNVFSAGWDCELDVIEPNERCGHCVPLRTYEGKKMFKAHFNEVTRFAAAERPAIFTHRTGCSRSRWR
jgi:hypothetical protein